MMNQPIFKPMPSKTPNPARPFRGRAGSLKRGATAKNPSNLDMSKSAMINSQTLFFFNDELNKIAGCVSHAKKTKKKPKPLTKTAARFVSKIGLRSAGKMKLKGPLKRPTNVSWQSGAHAAQPALSTSVTQTRSMPKSIESYVKTAYTTLPKSGVTTRTVGEIGPSSRSLLKPSFVMPMGVR